MNLRRDLDQPRLVYKRGRVMEISDLSGDCNLGNCNVKGELIEQTMSGWFAMFACLLVCNQTDQTTQSEAARHPTPSTIFFPFQFEFSLSTANSTSRIPLVKYRPPKLPAANYSALLLGLSTTIRGIHVTQT